MKYRNYDDIMKDLNDCKEDIYKDEDYHWWTGNIDGCWYCNIISSDERNSLLLRLEEIYHKIK